MTGGASKPEQAYLSEVPALLWGGVEEARDRAGRGVRGAGEWEPPGKHIRNPLWSQEGTFYHTKESFLILIWKQG